MNKFAEYVRSTSFNISLTQSMVNALICVINGREFEADSNSLAALERRGLIEYADGWTTTIPGWKVYDLLKAADYDVETLPYRVVA